METNVNTLIASTIVIEYNAITIPNCLLNPNGAKRPSGANHNAQT